MKWRCLDRTLDLSRRGEIMGIVNVTPDSFSDGGLFATVDAAVEQAKRLIAEGASFIDVGGESTRPGAAEVGEAEELRRVLPVISRLAAESPGTILSIDTCKAGVAAAAVAAGARVINDVRGFRDPAMIEVAARTGAGLVVMHMQGTPRTMQAAPVYADLHAEITAFSATGSRRSPPPASIRGRGLRSRDRLRENPRPQSRDSEGIGALPRRRTAPAPRVSRKSFIGKLTGSDRIEDRNWPTVAITALAGNRVSSSTASTR